jgi:hypothetical protein
VAEGNGLLNSWRHSPESLAISLLPALALAKQRTMRYSVFLMVLLVSPHFPIHFTTLFTTV